MNKFAILRYDNQSSIKLFLVSKIFSEIYISRMGLKVNLWLKTESYSADPEIGFPTKSILQQFVLTVPCRQSDSLGDYRFEGFEGSKGNRGLNKYPKYLELHHK